MSDTATVVTENTAPVTQAPAPDAAPSIQGNPAQDEARRQLYEKHYGTAEGTSSSPASAVETPQAPAAPIPVAAPAAPAPFPPEYLQVLQAVQAELAQLKSAVTPTAPEVNTEPEPGWITLLREGRVQEAQAKLVKDVAKELQPGTVDQAVNRAREVARAEADIESFVKDLKTANPELLVMENFVTAEAQQRLARVQASGVIKTTEDAVREYKKAVLEATESARKIASTLRGAGKSEAMVRSREVLSASTPTPQQITPRQETTEQSNEPAPESLESYFEKRKALESGLKNPYSR